MDLVAKLECSEMATPMVDYLKKWLEVYALRSKVAEEVADCIMDLFYKHAAPKRILTEIGKEFENKVS